MLARLKNAPGRIVKIARQVRRREGRDAASALQKAGVPLLRSIDLTRRLKIAANPMTFMGRRVSARPPISPFEKSLARNHFVRVPDATFPGADAVVAHCAGLFEAKREAVVAAFRPPSAEVIRMQSYGNEPVIEDVEEIRPIAKFLAQPAVFEVISRYLGERPVLSTVALIYTEPNKAIQDSQAFHRDLQDRNLIHLLMPIWPIDEQTGPFTLLPSDESDKVISVVGEDVVRITDEQIFNVVPKSSLVRLTGEPGAVYLCNPFRCIHYGARARSKSRLVLIVNLASAFEAVEGMQCIYRAKNRRELDDGSREMRWLLDL